MKIWYFSEQKLQFTYRWAALKDVKVKGEAFSHLRERPALQNMKFRNFFLFLWVIFALLTTVPDSNTDPDPLT